MVTADLAAPDPSVLESDVHGAGVILPGLGRAEVFGPDSAINRHFTTATSPPPLHHRASGGVPGRRHPDATAELRSAGVEILYESGVDDSGNGWVRFRAPDGNIYEFTQDPGVSRPQ